MDSGGERVILMASAPHGPVEIRVERAVGARIGRRGGADRWRASAQTPARALAGVDEHLAGRDELGGRPTQP